MSIGTGIAILGIWLFPCACAVSRNVNSSGFFLSFIAALAATYWLAS